MNSNIHDQAIEIVLSAGSTDSWLAGLEFRRLPGRELSAAAAWKENVLH
jgi:hypothetical protein